MPYAYVYHLMCIVCYVLYSGISESHTKNYLKIFQTLDAHSCQHLLPEITTQTLVICGLVQHTHSHTTQRQQHQSHAHCNSTINHGKHAQADTTCSYAAVLVVT